MSRGRAFTFTINNDNFADLDILLKSSFRYLCFGFEVGKEGTPHIQGYIYLYSPKTIKSLSKNVLPRAHIEHSKGTAKDNAVYTSKEDDWYEFGERPQQGKMKWEQIEDVMNDPTMNPHVYNQYNKMYRQLTLSKKKDHDRYLVLIPSCEQYTYAKKSRDEHGYEVTFDYSLDTYDGEDVIICPCYGDAFIIEWVNGFPKKIKRGYELICVDPQVVYVTYSDMKELGYLQKKYLQHIDAVF